MTRDTSGPTLSEPLGFFDPDSSSWRTSQGTFGSDSILSSRDLPRSGLMLRGRLFEHPTLGRRTGGSGSSSLLPTPVARDTNNLPGPNYSHSSLPRTVVDLLPTPHANMTTGPGTAGRDGGPNIQTAVAELLPTPTVGNVTGGNMRRGGKRSNELLLPGVVAELLPTPTASDYGSNRGGRGGRVGKVRPSLGTLAKTLTGDSTDPPSNGGSGSLDDQPPTQPPSGPEGG